MKNQKFSIRFRNAFRGILVAIKSEASFRTQLAFGGAAVAFLCALKPEPLWWAVIALSVGLVLAAELINTSLEITIDRLHPERHPTIGKAKDCAAGAVLVLSLAAVAVAIAFLVSRF